MTIHIERLTGDEMPAALPALARLRISEFLDWPYLYNGTLAYEENYLKECLQRGNLLGLPVKARLKK